MRLNNDMRDAILTKVVETTFAAEDAALVEREAALALKVRNSLMKPAEIAAIESLPRKFFPLTSYIYTQLVSIPNDYVRLNVNSSVAVPACMVGTAHLVEGELAVEIAAYAKQSKTFQQNKSAFQYKTKGLLSTFSDSCKLLKEWPTLQSLMGDAFFTRAAPRTPNLPSVIVNELDVYLQAAMKLAA